MFYIADLHLHSHYSRATSRDMNLENLWRWARIKGIHVVSAGDFTHPLWFKEMKEKLEPDGTGFFRLKNPPKDDVPGFKCHDIDVRFCLSTEISSIYKYGDKVRKNHNCVYAPDFETIARLNAKLSQIGNLASDGRPILGLPARNLLGLILETSGDAHLIPAHIWTPWFSMLGSRSGYDSVKECFRDLSHHIFALETGLSSDPEMNWCLSMLDNYSLVSNSDAHSPQKLGREANLFDTERSYYAMFDALKTKKGFLGTYEFFPEEGKYHLDGHRNCGVCLEPHETIKYKGICPKCGQPLTVGVLHRVTALADRTEPKRPDGAPGFHYIIPLPEIIAELKNSSPSSKNVIQSFQQIISSFGNEFTFLNDIPLIDIEKKFGHIVSEAIRRMRTQQVNPEGGYDGEFGVIKIFKEGEIESLGGQQDFFGMSHARKTTRRKTKQVELSGSLPPDSSGIHTHPADHKNTEQEEAEHSVHCPVLVTAGPGTGKTKTLVHRVANCIKITNAKPQEILAVTFTHKAADEMKKRLASLLGGQSKGIVVGTFHSICYGILQRSNKDIQTVYDGRSREIILELLFPGKEAKETEKLAGELETYFEKNSVILPCTHDNDKSIEEIARMYRVYCHQNGGIDIADIIPGVVRLWKNEPQWLEILRNEFQYIAVDELQDINPVQYEFLRMLAKDKNIFAIGDPDQSIYGFRGSEVKLFFRFKEDFNAKEIFLKTNYRSSGNIVEGALNLICNNTGRKDSSLSAIKSSSLKIKCFTAADELDEAQFIINEIENLIGGIQNLSGNYSSSRHTGRYGFSDIAVLFRTRAVGKSLFRHFSRSFIPVRYGDASQWISSPPFSVVADVLKLYLNPKDRVAMYSFITHGLKLNEKDKKQLMSSVMKGEKSPLFFWESWTGITAEEAVKSIFEKCVMDDTDEIRVKKETILDMARENHTGIEDFLHCLTLGLYTDTGRMKADAVQLLTFHASKGLEFPVVFITGAEDGITPVTRKDTPVEEERRLFYVAMTRAKDELIITHARRRTKFGEVAVQKVSPFLDEIPKRLVEEVRRKEKAEQLRLF